MGRFTADDLISRRWRASVLDVRDSFTFYGREEDATGTTVHTYRNTASNSGGEQEKLVAFCLSAALRYNLADESDGRPRFAPLMLDEAFSKSDETFSAQALAAFDEFGFQLLIAAPIRLSGIVEPYIGQAILVEKRLTADGAHSNAASATFGELAAGESTNPTETCVRRPEEVNSSLSDRFNRDYPAWARGQGTWPLRIPLGPPTTAQRSADPVACHAWADEWRAYSGPGEVEHASMRFPTGTHDMPKALLLRRPRDVAAVHPDTGQTWERCGHRLTMLERAFPGARFTGVIRRITDLDEGDYQRLVGAVTWPRANPASGLLLRQLPIEGIGTKWLSSHAQLVLALLEHDDLGLAPQEADHPVNGAPRRSADGDADRSRLSMVNIDIVISVDRSAEMGARRRSARGGRGLARDNAPTSVQVERQEEQ